MIVELIKLASELDSRGLVKEADVIDKVIFKFAGGIPLDIDGNPVEGAEGPGWLVGAEGEVEETTPGPIGDGMSLYDATLGKDFMKAFRLLTPHQLDVLGDLLMEGGPADATGSESERAAATTDSESPPAKGFLDWDKPVGSSRSWADREKDIPEHRLTPAQLARREGGNWNKADDGTT